MSVVLARVKGVLPTYVTFEPVHVEGVTDTVIVGDKDPGYQLLVGIYVGQRVELQVRVIPPNISLFGHLALVGVNRVMR